jgi:hypothetical protein
MDDPFAYGRQTTKFALVMVFILADIAAAVFVLAGWDWLAPFMTEPLGWATATQLPPRPGLSEYPCTLLWMGPLAAAVAAWTMRKLRFIKFALGFAVFPIFFGALAAGWFYWTPLAWH